MNKHSVLGLAGIIALSAACSGQDAVDNTEDGNWLDKNCEQTTVGEPALRRLTKRELQNTIEDLFPELEGRWSQVQLGPDPRSEDGFSNSSDMLVMNEQTAKDWLSTAEEVADALTAPEVLGQIFALFDVERR